MKSIKLMKSLIVMGMLAFFSKAALAQKTDCKFAKYRDANGQPIEAIVASGKLGNFLMWKQDGKILLNYTPKLLFGLVADDTKNKIRLRVDSVQFFFDNNTFVTVKVNGSGTLPNINNQLKPGFEQVTFNLLLDSQKLITAFTETKLKGFKVIAEKEAQFADLLNDKQKEIFSKGYACLK